jgi:hypothetical protein
MAGTKPGHDEEANPFQAVRGCCPYLWPATQDELIVQPATPVSSMRGPKLSQRSPLKPIICSCLMRQLAENFDEKSIGAN